MLKKLLIAAVAVVAGLAVLNFSLVRVWVKSCCHTMSRQVPPEVRLQQLNAEIDNIDKDIKKNIGTLARMEVQTERMADDLVKMRQNKEKLAARMESLEKNLEARDGKVAKIGRKSDVIAELDSKTSDYQNLTLRIKEQEKLVEQKKRNLETSLARITKMRQEKEKLRQLSAKLENQIELVKMQQMDARVNDIDDSAVTRCRQIADEIETYLREKEVETKHLKDFGYDTPESRFDKESKSVEEVLKASKQARQDEVEEVAVGNDKK